MPLLPATLVTVFWMILLFENFRTYFADVLGSLQDMQCTKNTYFYYEWSLFKTLSFLDARLTKDFFNNKSIKMFLTKAGQIFNV